MPTSKPIFRTAYGERERHFVTSGSPIADEYGYEINKLGSKVLVKTGETNLYKRIQLHQESVQIENVLKRASIGDMSDFRADGIYIDTSELPKDLITARQQMQKVENLWNQLSPELKEKYHNDVGEFIGAAGSDGWLKDMGYIQDKPTTSEEVISEAKGEAGDE